MKLRNSTLRTLYLKNRNSPKQPMTTNNLKKINTVKLCHPEKCNWHKGIKYLYPGRMLLVDSENSNNQRHCLEKATLIGTTDSWYVKKDMEIGVNKKRRAAHSCLQTLILNRLNS